MRPIKTDPDAVNIGGGHDDVADLWVNPMEDGHVQAVLELDDDEREVLAGGGYVVIGFLGPIPPHYVGVLAEQSVTKLGENHYRNDFPDLPDPRP